mgnify:CR=1 FL=1
MSIIIMISMPSLHSSICSSVVCGRANAKIINNTIAAIIAGGMNLKKLERSFLILSLLRAIGNFWLASLCISHLRIKIIGIKIGPANNEFNKEKLGPTKAVYYATKEIWFVSKTTIQFVGSMFQGKADTSQLGGPIKIAKISGQVMEFGILAFLSTIAYISISLGLINLFPIPLLDGGHLMFYLFEKILGRPLSQATQEGFFRIGLFLLLSLMLFTSFSDLRDLGLF